MPAPMGYSRVKIRLPAPAERKCRLFSYIGCISFFAPPILKTYFFTFFTTPLWPKKAKLLLHSEYQAVVVRESEKYLLD